MEQLYSIREHENKENPKERLHLYIREWNTAKKIYETISHPLCNNPKVKWDDTGKYKMDLTRTKVKDEIKSNSEMCKTCIKVFES